MRILFVFGTRPEAIKLFPVIYAFGKVAECELTICVTGQHRSMLSQVLQLAGIVPEFDLKIMKPNQSLGDITAACVSGVQAVIEKVAPDLVVVQGDTTTAMSSALAAFYCRVPVAHVEAGLRSGDLNAPWPEEVNRKIISTLAELHFAPTQTASDHLCREGIASELIHVTGNTVVDALQWMRTRLAAEPWPKEIAALLPSLESGKRLILVTMHRRENFDGGIRRIASALARLAARGDVEIVLPVHMNPNVRDPVYDVLDGCQSVHLLEPLDYLPFVQLMSRASLIITDSGGVQEEAPAFGIPVLITRETTERPEAVTAGTAILVGSNETLILNTANQLLNDASMHRAMSMQHNPFGDGNAAGHIVEIVRAWWQREVT
jgi:UDP-N-acetylglucosamine 2-epimerase (non-hydrolysing)